MSTRPPAVAGQFYDADPLRLQEHVSALLKAAPRGPRIIPRALIAPHAGYVYSGQTAACAYRTVSALAGSIERVVLYGPAHRVALKGMAVPSVDHFATPLGTIPLDLELIRQAAALPAVTQSDEAHRLEHSLEVHLPFLQTVLGEFSLTPIVVGWPTAQQVAAVVDALWGGPETLVVISTDLSHFHNHADAQRLDALTCDRILGKADDLEGEDACGAHALNGLMRSRHGRSLQVSQLNCCNSGDTAGNKRRVVGYGAFALH